MSESMNAKKHALRLLHHNVAIVSSGFGPEAIGATVTWFMQTSFEPPLVTLAVKTDSRLYTEIKTNQNLVISLVKKGDKAMAGAFFKPATWNDGKFGGFKAIAHKSGGAILDASPAWLNCKVITIVQEGDHHLFVSEVVDSGINNVEEQAMCLSETGWHYGG